MKMNITYGKPSLPTGLATLGWLFTIGWANLSFWQGVLAILIWPYYIGAKLAGLM